MSQREFLNREAVVAKRRAAKLRKTQRWVLEAFKRGMNTFEIGERIGASEAAAVIILNQARERPSSRKAAA